jgi:hypothetical protein
MILLLIRRDAMYCVFTRRHVIFIRKWITTSWILPQRTWLRQPVLFELWATASVRFTSQRILKCCKFITGSVPMNINSGIHQFFYLFNIIFFDREKKITGRYLGCRFRFMFIGNLFVHVFGISVYLFYICCNYSVEFSQGFGNISSIALF